MQDHAHLFRLFITCMLSKMSVRSAHSMHASPICLLVACSILQSRCCGCCNAGSPRLQPMHLIGQAWCVLAAMSASSKW